MQSKIQCNTTKPHFLNRNICALCAIYSLCKVLRHLAFHEATSAHLRNNGLLWPGVFHCVVSISFLNLEVARGGHEIDYINQRQYRVQSEAGHYETIAINKKT